MLRFPAPLLARLVTLLALALPTHADEPVEPSLLDGLELRLVGPLRDGRVTAVTGVPDNPQLYYTGAAGGGVWKSHKAGISWENISDGHIPVGTIGAIAVAPTDPNVIYVGTGEAPIRGVTTSWKVAGCPAGLRARH